MAHTVSITEEPNRILECFFIGITSAFTDSDLSDNHSDVKRTTTSAIKR